MLSIFVTYTFAAEYGNMPAICKMKRTEITANRTIQTASDSGPRWVGQSLGFVGSVCYVLFFCKELTMFDQATLPVWAQATSRSQLLVVWQHLETPTSCSVLFVNVCERLFGRSPQASRHAFHIAV